MTNNTRAEKLYQTLTDMRFYEKEPAKDAYIRAIEKAFVDETSFLEVRLAEAEASLHYAKLELAYAKSLNVEIN